MYVQIETVYARTERDSVSTHREGQCMYVQIGIEHVRSERDSVRTYSQG